jgi:hypothetical protein
MSSTRLLRNTLLISTVILLLLALSKTIFTYTRDPYTLLELRWRRTTRHPYLQRLSPQAPLYGCQARRVIPGAYTIYLHKGHSIDQHLATMSKTTAVTFQMHHVSEESYNLGAHYYADNVDDGTVEAIRKDPLVDLVECQFELGINGAEGVLEALWDSDTGEWRKPRPEEEMGKPMPEVGVWDRDAQEWRVPMPEEL